MPVCRRVVALVGTVIIMKDVNLAQQEHRVPMDINVILVIAINGLQQDPRFAHQSEEVVPQDNIQQLNHLPTKVPTERVVRVRTRRVEVTNIAGSAMEMVEVQTTA
jgi:hypothetical protein